MDTVFSSAPVMALFGGLTLSARKLIVSLVLAVVIKLLLDLYFRTKSGLLLRAVGDNSTLVTTLAQNKGNMKVLGVVISNALVALCGSVLCQEQRSYSAVMGIGQVVFGLATVIIGISLVHFFHPVQSLPGPAEGQGPPVSGHPQGTTAVLLGSILYKFCIQIAINAGLPANMLKFITAALFLLVLVVAGRRGRRSSMLELRDLTKIYNAGTVTELKLFDHFNLTVDDGQFLSIVGSNGSGKTSLLNILCGSIPWTGVMCSWTARASASRRTSSVTPPSAGCTKTLPWAPAPT